MLTENEDLAKRLSFLNKTDAMKYVIRHTIVGNGSRFENDAEHSFSFALTALVLAPYASKDVRIDRVIRMALVHDLVEIYAGDTYAYDSVGNESKADRERVAADKLYGFLPKETACELRALWEEFDAEQTPDARFAACVDHFQPLLLNYQSQGKSWIEHGISVEVVRKRDQNIKENAPALYEVVEKILSEAVEKGWLKP